MWETVLLNYEARGKEEFTFLRALALVISKKVEEHLNVNDSFGLIHPVTT